MLDEASKAGSFVAQHDILKVIEIILKNYKAAKQDDKSNISFNNMINKFIYCPQVAVQKESIALADIVFREFVDSDPISDKSMVTKINNLMRMHILQLKYGKHKQGLISLGAKNQHLIMIQLEASVKAYIAKRPPIFDNSLMELVKGLWVVGLIRSPQPTGEEPVGGVQQSQW